MLFSRDLNVSPRGLATVRPAGPIPATISAVLFACLGLGGCLTDGAQRGSESEATGWPGAKIEKASPELVAEGRRIAERHCSSCHAIDQVSVSPPSGAPPLRDLLFLNDPDLVAYRLIDSIRLGHDKMPLFDFDVRAADALVAYLGTISGPD